MECNALIDMIEWFTDLGEDVMATACPDMTCHLCFEVPIDLRVAA